MEVAIFPVGNVDPGLIAQLESDMRRGGLTVQTLSTREIPPNSLHRSRGQHRAEAFLELAEGGAGGYTLVITDVDLYAKPLNFVFGQAQMGGGSAVISLHRLRTTSQELFHRRTLKEALHELGHCIGLDHCDTTTCVMHFSNTLVDTDRKGPGFCKRCHRRASPVALWRA